MRELKLNEMNVVAGGADDATSNDSDTGTVVDTAGEDPVAVLIEDTTIAIVPLPEHIANLIEHIRSNIYAAS